MAACAALTGLAVASAKKPDKLLAEAETHLTEALTRCRALIGGIGAGYSAGVGAVAESKEGEGAKSRQRRH
jgi:hypothetical protein